MENNKKMAYERPSVTSINVELEHGVAAGSVQPNSVKEEWETIPDDNRSIDW